MNNWNRTRYFTPVEKYNESVRVSLNVFYLIVDTQKIFHMGKSKEVQFV